MRKIPITRRNPYNSGMFTSSRHDRSAAARVIILLQACHYGWRTACDGLPAGHGSGPTPVITLYFIGAAATISGKSLCRSADGRDAPQSGPRQKRRTARLPADGSEHMAPGITCGVVKNTPMFKNCMRTGYSFFCTYNL